MIFLELTNMNGTKIHVNMASVQQIRPIVRDNVSGSRIFTAGQEYENEVRETQKEIMAQLYYEEQQK